MSVLTQAQTEHLDKLIQDIALPAHDDLRTPENGLVMVRGRIGGDGAPFNVGEATISRATIQLASGEIGFGYVLGRDRNKARLIALCDAMIQSKDHRDAVERMVIQPLRDAVEAAKRERAAHTAATRVDFYTLVRGEG